jgi:hypothetical protein
MNIVTKLILKSETCPRRYSSASVFFFSKSLCIANTALLLICFAGIYYILVCELGYIVGCGYGMNFLPACGYG